MPTTTPSAPPAPPPNLSLAQATSANSIEDADRRAVSRHRARSRCPSRHRRSAVRRTRNRDRSQYRDGTAIAHSAANFVVAQLGAHSHRGARRLLSRSPPSIPTPTTPASCTKPPFHLPNSTRARAQTLQLDVTYSGTIPPTARRLLSVGTPEDSASHSDWDQINPAFTGLRGFGNVVWYPASSVPVIIGDGARLFDEIGRQKLRSSGSEFRLRLTVEFPHGQAPTSCRHQRQRHPAEGQSIRKARVLTCQGLRPLTRGRTHARLRVAEPFRHHRGQPTREPI